MKYIPLLFLIISLISCNINDILEGAEPSIFSELSDEEIAEGLMVALENGIQHGVDDIKRESYNHLYEESIKILLPEDVASALNQVDSAKTSFEGFINSNEFISSLGAASLLSDLLNSMLGLDAWRDQLISGFNAAADKAAPVSIEIFKNVIYNLTFTEASNILFADDSSAATDYLESQSRSELYALFKPEVSSVLDQIEMTQLWEDFAKEYNEIRSDYISIVGTLNSQISTLNDNSFGVLNYDTYDMVDVDTLTTDLSDYTTNKAMDGLFFVISVEEKEIRQDPFAYVTDIGKSILERVFGE